MSPNSKYRGRPLNIKPAACTTSPLRILAVLCKTPSTPQSAKAIATALGAPATKADVSQALQQQVRQGHVAKASPPSARTPTYLPTQTGIAQARTAGLPIAGTRQTNTRSRFSAGKPKPTAAKQVGA